MASRHPQVKVPSLASAGADKSSSASASADSSNRDDVDSDDNDEDWDNEISDVELRPERAQQYDTARGALGELIAGSRFNNWEDETKWLLSIAEAAIFAARTLEQSSFPEMDEAFSAISDAIVLGSEPLDLTPTQRIARDIMRHVMSWGYDDNKTGLTQQILASDLDDEDRENENVRVKISSEALALLRGVGDLSRKQARVLVELHEFTSQFEKETDNWIADALKAILEDMPEVCPVSGVADSDGARLSAVAAMRKIIKGKQTFQEWDVLNTFLVSLGVGSNRAATVGEYRKWPPHRRRGYQHPVAKVWQGVKKGKFGYFPFV